MDRMEHGPLTGSYARDVRVIVYDGKMHPVDSNELSFMLAARNAFSAAFKEAGPKILLGNKEGEWATYDFSDDMRSLQFGIALGADFKVGNRWGLSADLNWGLTGIFNSDFKTVEQTLYRLYERGGSDFIWKFLYYKFLWIRCVELGPDGHLS